MDFDKIGGRKFAIVLLSLLLSFSLVWFGKMTDQIFANIVMTTLALYIAGNVTQKFKVSGDSELSAAPTKEDTTK